MHLQELGQRTEAYFWSEEKGVQGQYLRLIGRYIHNACLLQEWNDSNGKRRAKQQADAYAS